MATEINIQESVFLKKGEKEENALTSESFEEKVTELSGNIMKQLETNSLMAETVNTPLETGKPTSESETFFQALSVPMVVADEHNNEPESFKAAKQTETEEKAEDEVRSEVFDSVAPAKKDDVSVLEKNEGDSDGVTSSQDAVCEDIKETTTEQHASTVVDVKEQDLSREFVKEETEDKLVNSLEASEPCEIESKDIEEQKPEENVKKIEQDEEIKEIKPDVEQEKQEQNGLLQEAITSDVCISTDSKTQVETEEHEEKDEDANVLVEDKDKNDITSMQEVAVEEDLQEKSHHNEDTEHQVSEVKESIEEDNDVVKESIKNEETNDEKAIEKEVCEENGPKKAEFEEALEVSESVVPHQQETFNVLEKDKGDSDGVTSSQESPYVAVEETTTDQHVTTVIDFKEQDMNEKPREFIEEETKDILLDAQEASKECENGAKEEIEQNPEESVMKIEKEEETVESVTNDASVSTQTKSQVEKPEHEEEKICEEIGSEKVEYEKEVEDSAATVFNKDKIEDEDEKTEQEVSMLKKDEGEDGVTSAHDVAFEKDLQEKIHHNENDESEVVTAEESIEKDTEVCIPTQTEPEEEKTNKNDEEVIERDDDQTNKSVTPIMKEIGEENVSEKTESEEAKDKSVDVQEETKQYDDGAKGEKEQKLEESVDETTHSYSKNEEEEYAEEFKPSDETIEEKEVGISTQIESLKDASKNEDNYIVTDDLKKTESEEIQVSDSSNVKTRESVDAATEEGVKQSDNFSTTLNEKEIMSKEEEIKASKVQGVGDDITSSQSASNEDLKETTIGQHDANVTYVEKVQGVSATSKEVPIEEAEYKSIDAQEISLEHGQPNEQYVEEITPCLSETISENPKDEIKKDEKDLTQESVKDTNDDATKEEKGALLEQETVEEQSGQDDASKEKVIDLNETTETEPQEDVTSSTSLETSTKDTLNSEKEQEESENLPIKGLETVSDVQLLELVSKSEESMLKEDCTVSEIETHLDEEKETVTKEILSDEKTEVQGDVTNSHNTSNEYTQETTTDQHDTTIAEGVSATSKEILIEEPEYKSVDAEEILLESVQSNEQNVEETQRLSKTLSQNPEAEINKEDKEIKPSDETIDEKEVGISAQVESQEDASKNEENDIASDDLKMTESEEIQVSDSSNVKTRESVDVDTEEGVKQCDNFGTTLNENEIMTKEETLTKEEEIKASEVQGAGDDITSSYSASNEYLKETTICQNDTIVTYVEEVQGVSATPKEIIIEEAEDKSVDAQEISLEHGQPDEQYVEETTPCLSETISENPKDEIKKDEKDLTQESVKDTNDDATKEEKGTLLEQETVEEQSDQDIVSKEKVIDSTETTDIEAQKDIASSTLLETSTKDTLNSEKEQEESENLPIKDIETVSDVQIPELVSKSDDSMLKEDCFISETETHLNEEKEAVTKEISSDEKTKVQGDGDDVTSSHNTSNEYIQETTTNQHDTTIAEGVSAMSKEILIEEPEYKLVDAKEILLESVQSNEQNDEETQSLSKTLSQNPEAEINKEDNDLSREVVEDTKDNTIKEEIRALEHESVEEHNGLDEVSKEEITYLNETTEVKVQEDITPSGSLEASTEGASNSEKEKAESENLPIEELETVSEVKIPETVPKSEESVLKEESYVSEKGTQLDEEKRTVTEEISSDEKTEPITEINQEVVKEICEETNLEKAEFEEPKLYDSSIVKINEDLQDIEEIKSSVETEEITETYENEEKISEKAIENDDNETVTEKENLEKKQDDVEETKMGEHDTTTKDAISKEEEEIERYGDVSNDEKDQKPEEHIDEIITSVETNEEKDVSISTHIESQEDATKDEEQAIENDGDQKEKLDDDPFVKEACEENDLKKTESEEERQIPNSDNVRTRESVVEDIEEPKSNDDTKENTDQQGLLHETNETLSKEEKLEEEHEIKTSEVQGGVDDVTSSQNASNVDKQETTIDQHDTTIAHVEQGQDVNEMPKEILIEEAETKSIDSEEISLELEQPDKQNPEEEIKKQDKDLSLESVENTDKEEESTLKQEPVEEHSGIDEVSKEKAIDINETAEVEPQEDITPSNLVEKSTEDTSNLESMLKEEFISKTETHLDEEKEIETKETSSDENKEQTTELKQETVCEETSSEKAEFEEGLKLSNDNSDIKISEEVISTFKDGEQEKDQEVKVSEKNQGEDSIPSSQNEVSEETEDLQEKIYHYEGNKHDIIESSEGVNEDPEEIKSSVEIENAEHVVTTNVANSTQTESGEESKENDGEKAVECDQTEIASRDVNIETKQEDDVKIYLENQEKDQEFTTSELQGDEDDVISSKDAVNEDSKETEIGQSATTIVQFEEVGVNAITKDVIGEDIEVKSVHAQEASEQCENETNETTEQQPEETVKEPVNSGSETIKESFQEEDNQADRTEDRSEMKDEVILTENVSKDLGEIEVQNVEEIQECITETISEKTEDVITKDEDLSHDNVTKEEKNIEISTLEHEPVEEQNNSQNVTQESQFNSTEDCSETVKDVILTEEIEQVSLEIEKEKGITDFKEQIVEEDSYSPKLEVKSAQNQEDLVHEISNSDSIPVETPEVTEVNVDDQIEQEALQGKEEINCVSKVTDDKVDQEPIEEIISSQVDSTKMESTAYPLESDVQISEVVADSEDLKMKEECIGLATADNTDGNNLEEKEIKTKDISSAPETDHENVTNAPDKSDEVKSSDLIIEEKAITNENLEVHEELGPTSEPVTEDQVTIEEKPQPEQSDITSESVKNDPTLESKLEHTSEKDSDAKEDIEEDVTLAPENEIKSKNIILTEKVEYSKPVPVENTEVTEVKAESQIEVENIHAEEDLSGVSKESSIIETSKVEMYEDTKKTIIAEVKDDNIYEASKDNTVPVLEDSKASGNEKMEDAIINEIERSSSRPDELLETKNSVEDAKDPKFISDNLNIQDETFTEAKGPNEDSEIKTEVAEIVPECKEASVTDVKNTEDPEVVPSVEKEITVDVQKNEKDIDHETKVKTADVSSNVESSEIEPSREEETFEFINQQKQIEHKEADVSIEAVNPVEDVKTSTREFEFRSVDFEVPTVTDATANKADNKTVEVHEAEKELLKDNEHLESKCDQSKPVEEDSKMKQQPLQLDAPETLDIAITKDLKISQKNVTDDMLHEPAKEDSKVSENLIGEKDSSLTKDLQVEKDETGESGVKTDEEGHEEEDNEDDEKMGSGSDAPVMVEASKDIDVKVHKKSHNILSGVGSKVKHSIAKVKKAITGKSSPQKSPSPKASNQVVD